MEGGRENSPEKESRSTSVSKRETDVITIENLLRPRKTPILPRKHPHRANRKVSAPPELQHHLGGSRMNLAKSSKSDSHSHHRGHHHGKTDGSKETHEVEVHGRRSRASSSARSVASGIHSNFSSLTDVSAMNSMFDLNDIDDDNDIPVFINSAPNGVPDIVLSMDSTSLRSRSASVAGSMRGRRRPRSLSNSFLTDTSGGNLSKYKALHGSRLSVNTEFAAPPSRQHRRRSHSQGADYRASCGDLRLEVNKDTSSNLLYASNDSFNPGTPSSTGSIEHNINGDIQLVTPNSDMVIRKTSASTPISNTNSRRDSVSSQYNKDTINRQRPGSAQGQSRFIISNEFTNEQNMPRVYRSHSNSSAQGIYSQRPLTTPNTASYQSVRDMPKDGLIHGDQNGSQGTHMTYLDSSHSSNMSTAEIPAVGMDPNYSMYNGDHIANPATTEWVASSFEQPAENTPPVWKTLSFALGDEKFPDNEEQLTTQVPKDLDDVGEDPDADPGQFKKRLIDNTSLMYGLLMFTMGSVIYLGDSVVKSNSALAEGFNIYLVLVGFIWLILLHVDVRRYLMTVQKAYSASNKNGDNSTNSLRSMEESSKTLIQHYGFTSGRHGGSLYLKIGATVFCFGHLIHTGLVLGQKVLYILNDESGNCAEGADIAMSLLQPIFAFYQLFFVFKHSNLIINRHKLISRFALVHCITASLCFWFYAIVQETHHSIMSKNKKGAYAKYPSSKSYYDPYNNTDDGGYSSEDDSYHNNSYEDTYNSPLMKMDHSDEFACPETSLTGMLKISTPFLFPFSIEYYILIVGVWILILENVGQIDRHTHIPSVAIRDAEDNSHHFTSNLIIYVDCHSSSRGLFAGLLMTVASVVSIIVFFIYKNDVENVDVGRVVNGTTKAIFLTAMLIVCLLAFYSISQLDQVQHHVSQMDDILLFICLPFIFIYAFLYSIPAFIHGQYITIFAGILQIAEVLLQTVLICDGLRRCANKSSLQHRKPGREMITFLVVANVAMWLLETFEIKTQEGESLNYEFYGKMTWAVLSHTTLPLALFYRFHSSVCLADIWKQSYEPEDPEN